MSKRLIELGNLVRPYQRYDWDKNESYLLDTAPQEIKDIYPEYLKLREKELWDIND